MLDFHALYEAYAPDVYRFAYWLAGNAAEAEDITSETFIRAWTNRVAIRTETLKAYLLQIARHVYLDGLRKQKHQTDLQASYPDPHPRPEQVAENQDELETIRGLLQAQPEIDRAAFILRVQHDLPYVEIARVLQLSISAAKVKVHRTRKKLLLNFMSREVI